MMFAGVNLDEYQNWPKIQAPTGAVYYEIPGTGYVYDPVLSSAKGRPVIWTNPKPSIQAQSDAKQAQQDAIDAQKKAQSPANQLLPIAGAAGGTIAANAAVNALKPATAVGLTPSGSVLMSDGSMLGAGGQAAAQGAGLAGGEAAAQGVASAANGGTLMSDGSVVGAPGIGFAPYAGAAGALLGGMGIYNATKMKNKGKAAIAGGLSGAGMGAGLAAAAPLVGLGPLGWGALGLMALGGGGLGAALGGAFGGQSTGEIQAERWGDVGVANPNPQGFDYFAGTGGEQSRDEKFLTPDAIRFNPDNYRAAADYGGWDNWTKAQQDQFLSTLLNEGKVREKKGGIYLDDDRALELAKEIRGGK